MPKIGLCHAVGTPISSETHGSAMNYGTPFVIDPAMEANQAWDYANQKLPGDNSIVERNNEIIGGRLSLKTTGLTNAQKASLLGFVLSGSAYIRKSASAPYIGFGYVTVEQRTSGGVTTITYTGHWIYKIQFSMPTDNAKTKGDQIEFQSPTLEGEIMPVFLDGTGTPHWDTFEEKSTLAEAQAWVDAIAGLSLSQVATPAASTGAGEVASGTEITLTCATSGATIYYTTNGDTPTTGSMVYAAGIKVYEAMTIKAIAAKAGMSNSEIMSEAYTIPA